MVQTKPTPHCCCCSNQIDTPLLLWLKQSLHITASVDTEPTPSLLCFTRNQQHHNMSQFLNTITLAVDDMMITNQPSKFRGSAHRTLRAGVPNHYNTATALVPKQPTSSQLWFPHSSTTVCPPRRKLMDCTWTCLAAVGGVPPALLYLPPPPPRSRLLWKGTGASMVDGAGGGEGAARGWGGRHRGGPTVSYFPYCSDVGAWDVTMLKCIQMQQPLPLINILG